VIIIERCIFFSRLNKWEEQETKLLRLYVGQGRLDEARTVTAGWRSPLGRVANSALKQYELDKSNLEAAIHRAGEQEVRRMQRGLGLLDTVVTASPLLGLLGTVTGIIRSFTALSVVGSAQSAQLSMGIAEALYTTAFGLSIAIPALFFLNWFYGIAEQQAEKLTGGAQELLSILNKGQVKQDGV
ncbi:MAG TPA: MotA/TolQ/ExbB proton channel family protein, partial [Bacillota bacterium]|nr:MotA/TolQ/ExbB proton channel family protein [Bacillota bacterium]